MSPAPPPYVREELMCELRQCAEWEDLAGAIAAAKRLAALAGDEVPAGLVAELVSLDSVDLSEDAGDLADALYRKRAALESGLVACGERAAVWLRPLLAADAGGAGPVALRVLAELGDPAALAVARRWVNADDPAAQAAQLAAIHALGRLRPPDAASLLRAVVARADAETGSWTKRMAAHALGRIGDVAALEMMLADPDWFARLGAAEALATLPDGQGAAARQRASLDGDPRVASAARRNSAR